MLARSGQLPMSGDFEMSLRDIRLAASFLGVPRTRHHDLAERMLLRFLGLRARR
jgi:hypothetical protein